MRRIESFEDFKNGVVTYEFDNGRRIAFGVSDIERAGGAVQLMRQMGFSLPTERLPVFQYGRKIGTVAGDFDPYSISSTSFLYDPRPGDFVRVAEGWTAANNLGPGDLEAIPGFVWEPRHATD